MCVCVLPESIRELTVCGGHCPQGLLLLSEPTHSPLVPIYFSLLAPQLPPARHRVLVLC